MEHLMGILRRSVIVILAESILLSACGSSVQVKSSSGASASLSVSGHPASRDVYIAEGASGAGNGTDCADAYAYTFFNSTANWGTAAGQIGPGVTVHLCGVFNAPAGATGYLSFQGSGTTGSPITLKFETGAVLSAPYWGTGAISCAGNSFLTIDGGGSGLIEATQNGSAPDFPYQQDGEAVYCQNASGITIQNLTIANIYVHESNPSDENGQDTYGIDLQNGSNWTVDSNTIHDVKWAARMSFESNAYSNWTYSNNRVWGYPLDSGSPYRLWSGLAGSHN